MILVVVYRLLVKLGFHQLAGCWPLEVVQRYYCWFQKLSFFDGRIFFSFVKFLLYFFHDTLFSLANGISQEDGFGMAFIVSLLSLSDGFSMAFVVSLLSLSDGFGMAFVVHLLCFLDGFGMAFVVFLLSL